MRVSHYRLLYEPGTATRGGRWQICEIHAKDKRRYRQPFIIATTSAGAMNRLKDRLARMRSH